MSGVIIIREALKKILTMLQFESTLELVLSVCPFMTFTLASLRVLKGYLLIKVENSNDSATYS